MLENDAGDQLWIGSTPDRGLLVYEENGPIYADAPLDGFKRLLSPLGLRESIFFIPVPHSNHFHPQ